jgi:hypothetical protein
MAFLLPKEKTVANEPTPTNREKDLLRLLVARGSMSDEEIAAVLALSDEELHRLALEAGKAAAKVH